MTKLTGFSLRNPIAIVIMILLIVIGGLYSTTKLNEESMPDTSASVVYVNVVYPGASAQEAMDHVTAPLEKAINNVEGVVHITSTTSDSLVFLRVEFNPQDDLDLKKSKVEEAVGTVQLPAEVRHPQVEKNSADTNPIFFSSLVAKPGVSTADFQDEVLNRILPDVKSLSGVGGIQVMGLNTSKVSIKVDAQKLKDQKLTYQQVAQFLQAQDMSSPLGQVTLNKKDEMVTLDGTLTTIQQIEDLTLRTTPELHLKDLATVQQDSTSDTITSANGKPAVAFNVMKTHDANTVKVAQLVQTELAKYSDKVQLNVIYDTSKDIKSSVSSLAREGGLGALFAALLILIFLRNFRATIISIISIPMSILVTLIVLQQFNLTLNIMTLAGMVVATGRVVDDSIVVIENIMRRAQSESMSKELLISSVKEVVKAITSSTLTTIAVFAPLGLLSGIVGVIFGPFALTVVICLLSSLLVSVTVVPMLTYVMMRKKGASHHEEKESAMSIRYKKALNWALNHKAIMLILSIVLLVGALPLAASSGFTFLPDGQDKIVAMTLTLPPGTNLSEVQASAVTLDDKLRQDARVDHSQLVVGTPKGQSKSATLTNVANWFITLKSDANIDQFIKDEKAKLNPTQADTTLDLYRIVATPGGPDINITVNGSNKATITAAAQQITDAVKKVNGTENVKNNLQEGIKGVQVKVRSADALAHGLSTAQAMQLIRPYISEQKIGTVKEGNTTDDLTVQLTTANGLTSLDDISNLELYDATGHLIKIKDIADVQEVDQPGSLQHLDGQEYASVTATITSSNKSGVSTQVKNALKNLQLKDGATYSLGGANQQINDMMSSMGMAILIAICAVYVVMVITFGEGKAPFAILFAIPFALIGSLVANKISGQPISLNSMIGFLMLVGIVVTNAIVLLDMAGQHMAKGKTIRESLLAAGSIRLRPILMTAIATMLAILPMVIGLGESQLMSQGLAVVVLGGLISSTFLTLFIVPVMFEILHRKQIKKEVGTPTKAKKRQVVQITNA